LSRDEATIQSEAMVTIVFNAGAEALDLSNEERRALSDRTIMQLRMIAKGAAVLKMTRGITL
ncbi:MAG: DNA-binding transcriptional regulator FabR, partial [Saccharospirillaceae bacterium]|nr:DNA-binding transcriptional regulator FabR [Saccharospirillaceae bacterium]